MHQEYLILVAIMFLTQSKAAVKRRHITLTIPRTFEIITNPGSAT
jgi:hypothetical protein